MPAPTGVDAYLSGNGYQVTVNWSPTPKGTDTLLGYNVYRSCDNRDAVLVNADILSPSNSSFVDSSILKPGKSTHITLLLIMRAEVFDIRR